MWPLKIVKSCRKVAHAGRGEGDVAGAHCERAVAALPMLLDY